MILSDGDIATRIKDGSLGIEPEIDWRVQLQPCSVDLRLGPMLGWYQDRAEALDPITVDGDRELVFARIPDDGFVLHPGAFVLGATLERVSIPPDLLARIDGRSTYGRLGVTCHVTAGFIDPGFRGTITLEIANLGPRPVLLRAGERVCQVCFEWLSSPARIPYGDRLRASKYQDQEGPTAPRPTLADFIREG